MGTCGRGTSAVHAAAPGGGGGGGERGKWRSDRELSLRRVNGAMVLATTPGAETVVAGLPLAVRAVLALREAGFDDIGLVLRDRPRWAAEPLARRRVAVRWVGASSGGGGPST